MAHSLRPSLRPLHHDSPRFPLLAQSVTEWLPFRKIVGCGTCTELEAKEFTTNGILMAKPRPVATCCSLRNAIAMHSVEEGGSLFTPPVVLVLVLDEGEGGGIWHIVI